MDGGTARKIADKYITPDGKVPKPKTEDADPFGPAPESRESKDDARRERFEAERAVMEARARRDAKKAQVLAQMMAKVARAMKKKHVATGGWQTHPDILAAVTYWAANMKTQRWMASRLGKSARAMEDAFAKDKGDNPLRLAFEEGRAEAEQEKIDTWNELDPRDPKQVVGAIFFMKAQFNWRDRPDNATSDAPKIQFVLPGPMSEEEYYKKLGITGPVDTRPEVDRTRVLGGVAVGDMKDVTPGADGKMPTLGAQKILAGVSGEKK